MATYRQLPEVFRRLHPKFKTPWLSLIVFAGFVSILVLLPGKTRVPRDDVLVRRDALVHDRARLGDPAAPALSGPGARSSARGRTCAWRGVDWPLFAVFGGTATALAWLVVVVQSPGTRYAGLGWLALGFAVYFVYRRRVVQLPLTETVRAPIAMGPALALEYRNILVPVAPRLRLGARRWTSPAGSRPSARASIVALTALEVPLELPLDAELSGRVERRRTTSSTRRGRSATRTACA